MMYWLMWKTYLQFNVLAYLCYHCYHVFFCEAATSGLLKPTKKRRRQSGSASESIKGSAAPQSTDSSSPTPSHARKKRRPTGNTSGSDSTAINPSLALNERNFSIMNARGAHSSVHTQSELDDDAVWMFNSPSCTTADHDSSVTDVPSTTKSTSQCKRTSQAEDSTKENQPPASSNTMISGKLANKASQQYTYGQAPAASNMVLTSLHSGLVIL